MGGGVGVSVSISVGDILEAFTSCRKIVDRVRARKSRKRGTDKDNISESERYLNQSLSKAPVEIKAEYVQGLDTYGQKFGMGDLSAQTVLQATLAKLNSGLVDIIESFLASKDLSKLSLNYKALSRLSDVSRAETVSALAGLKDRLYRVKIGKGAVGRGIQSPPPILKSPSDGQSLPASKNAPKQYVAGVKQDKHVHWAVVRPRMKKKRVLSNSSEVSTSSSSSSTLTANSRRTNASNSDITLRASPPPVSRRPATYPDESRAPPPRTLPQKNKQHTTLQNSSTRLPLEEKNLAHVPAIPKLYSPDLPQQGNQYHNQAIPRRRVDRPTETLYSFASDSTKLGEIPMHRWPEPYNFEEMARLNAEAMASGWPSENLNGQSRQVRKNPGFLARVLRINPLAGIAEA